MMQLAEIDMVTELVESVIAAAQSVAGELASQAALAEDSPESPPGQVAAGSLARSSPEALENVSGFLKSCSCHGLSVHHQPPESAC